MKILLQIITTCIITSSFAMADLSKEIPPFKENLLNAYNSLNVQEPQERLNAISTIRQEGKTSPNLYILTMKILNAHLNKNSKNTKEVELIFNTISDRTAEEFKKEKAMGFLFYVKSKGFDNLSLKSISIQNIAFKDITLNSVDFSNSKLINVFFENTNLNNVNFTGTTLSMLNLENSKLTNVKFDNAQINTSAFGFNNLKEVSYVNTQLIKTHFKGSEFTNVNMTGSTLSDVNMTYAKLSSVNFTNATITNLNLSNALLKSIEGIKEDTIKNNWFIIKGEKQPKLPSYMESSKLMVKDKNLQVLSQFQAE